MKTQNSYIDVRAMREKAGELLLKACLSMVANDTPALRDPGNEKIWAQRGKELFNSLQWNASFLRLESAVPVGTASAPTQFVFNPLITSQLNTGRAAAKGITQDDLFMGFYEHLTIDGRQIGADASADWQGFPNPVHFLQAPYAIYAAGQEASVQKLNAIYSGQEVIKVVNVDYRVQGDVTQYLQIPELIGQTLTSGAATGQYTFFPKTRPVQSESVTLFSGQKQTTITVSMLSSPAIVVPTVGTSELVVTKWFWGIYVPQGKSLYEALMGVII